MPKQWGITQPIASAQNLPFIFHEVWNMDPIPFTFWQFLEETAEVSEKSVIYWLKILKFIIGPLSDDVLIDVAFSCLEQSQKK